MTTIVTTKANNYAVMVADSGITSDLMHPDMDKIVQNGTWLIGVVGEDRVCDVIQYTVKYPKVPQTLVGKPQKDWYAWLVTKVIPEMLTAIQQSNLHNKDANTILGDSSVLLVTHGNAFLITESLGVGLAEPYWAIGSGGQLAMGSLAEKNFALEWKVKHAELAKAAVNVAQKHDPFTRGKVSGYKSYPSGKIVSF